MERIWKVVSLGLNTVAVITSMQIAQASGPFPESRFGSDPADPTIFERSEFRAPAGLVVQDIKKDEEVKAEMQDAQQRVEKPASNFSSLVPESKKGVQEVSVIAGDLGFFPTTVFVTRDIPVRLFVTGTSDSALCIMMDSFNVRKQVNSRSIEEITFTPNVPGVYRFYCPVNQSEGRLVVKELASVQPE